MLVLAIILTVLAIGTLGLGLVLRNALAIAIGVGVFGIALVVGLFSSFYTQERGEAVVLKDWTGNVVGQTTDTGWHWKAPWVDTIHFNILNQPVYFLTPVGNSTTGDSYPSDGPQVTFQDADGVTSDMDITVVYSINPDAVTDIFTRYKDESAFKSQVIYQDVRSIARAVPNKFSTLEILTDRAAVQQSIEQALRERWNGTGVSVNQVNLQEIRPPEAVKESYAQAQQAKINVQREQANLDAAEVSAQQKVVQAQAEADANTILNNSLSGEILQQRYLDTLAKLAEAGNLVVVPEGFSGLVGTGR